MFAYCRNNPVRRIDISGAADADCIDDDPLDEEDILKSSQGGGNGDSPISGDSENITQLTTQLTECANKAKAGVSGKGPVAGTKIHSNFKAEVRKLNNPNLQAEASYSNGGEVNYGTKGSIRFDVVLLGSSGKPIFAWDLKTGNATLTDARIMHMQVQSGCHIPIMIVK